MPKKAAAESESGPKARTEAKWGEWDSLRSKVVRLMDHSSGYSQWFDARLRTWQVIHLVTSISIVLTTAISSILSKIPFESAAASAAVPVLGSVISGALATFLLWSQTYLRALIRAQQESVALSREIRDWARSYEKNLDEGQEKCDPTARASFRTFRDDIRLRYREISYRISSTIADEIVRRGDLTEVKTGVNKT